MIESGIFARRLACGLAAFLCTTFSLGGAPTRGFTHESYDDFKQGTPEGVCLASDGGLGMAPALAEIAEIEEPVIWDAVADPATGTLYLATGNVGRILKVDPVSGLSQRIYESPQVLVRGLALREGYLYAATSPDGEVVRIDLDSGEASTFFDPEDQYIWDLEFASDGTLFVATGNQGRIYRLPPGFEPGGNSREYARAGQPHLTTLLLTDEGTLLAGSSPGGILYRVDEPGRVFALFQVNRREVQRIQQTDTGEIIFSTVQDQSSAQAISVVPGAASGGEGSGENDEPEEEGGAMPVFTVQSSSVTSHLYRLQPDRFVLPFWTAIDANIYDYKRFGEEGFLVGTGERGELFWTAGLDQWSLLERLPEGEEISVLMPTADGSMLLFASHPGRIYRIEPRQARTGTFTSLPFDAGQIAQWGRLESTFRREVGVELSIETRSGNTDTPDETWSDWNPLTGSGQVRSPNARLLQYRVRFERSGEADWRGSQEALLRRIRGFYRTRDARPVVTNLRVLTYGVEASGSGSNLPTFDISKLLTSSRNPLEQARSRTSFRPTGRTGEVTLVWRGFDPDGDELRYDIRLRRESGQEDSGLEPVPWVILSREQEESWLTFNTRGFADGLYRAEIVAYTPGQEDASDAKRSSLFLIDNGSPVVSAEAATGSSAWIVTASDSHSIIVQATYRIDGGDPVPLSPEDSIFDQTTERFRIEPREGKLLGAASMVVEVTDEAGNRATGTISIAAD